MMALLWGKDKKDIYYPEQEETSNKLYHIGTPHQGNIPHSGRYEYGSGENARQHTTDPRELALKYREERNPDGTRKYTETERVSAPMKASSAGLVRQIFSSTSPLSSASGRPSCCGR